MTSAQQRNTVTIGETRYEGDKQQPVMLDVDEAKHGFLTGSTGAGKSNSVRVLVEETRGRKTRLGGRVHVAVFDTEGDLRPALETLGDFIVFSCDGPLVISPETAGLIARQQVELGFDALYDLTDWGKLDRGEIIAAYSQALADLKLEQSPKAFCRKLFVFYDEAQKYAPELSKQTKGVDYPASAAIIDLVSVGRKRGISAWVTSQRPAKVRADIRAECDIVIAGKLNRGDDRDAVLGDMGVERAARAKMSAGMRLLRKGDCIIVGEGLFDEPTPAHIKKARTDVPEDYGLKPVQAPPMSQAVQQVVAQLADIKARAKKEAATLEEARAYAHQLEHELAIAKREQRVVEVPKGIDEATVERRVRAAEDHVHKEWLTWADHNTRSARALLEGIASMAGQRWATPYPGNRATALGDNMPETPPRAPRPLAAAPVANRAARAVPAERGSVTDGLTLPKQRILDALAELHSIGMTRPRRELVAIYAEASPSSSGYANNLGALRTAGLIDYPEGGTVILTPSGEEKANPPAGDPTPKVVLERALRQLDNPKGRIVRALAEAWPDSLTREELAERAGASPDSSGYANNLGALRTAGFLDYPRKGTVRAMPWLLLEVDA